MYSIPSCKAKERKGKERKGKERKGKERKGKGREGRKGEREKGKEREKAVESDVRACVYLYTVCLYLSQTAYIF